MTSSKPQPRSEASAVAWMRCWARKARSSQVQATTAVIEPLPGEVLRKLPVGSCSRAKYQPRREMDEGKLSELADSIKSQGVIQPILVRQLPAGNYENSSPVNAVGAHRSWPAWTKCRWWCASWKTAPSSRWR